MDDFKQMLLEIVILQSTCKIFQVQGDKDHYQITIRPFQKGLADVVKEKFIHFDEL